MRHINRRKSAVTLLIAGLMTLGAGFALEGTASAVITHYPANAADYDLHLKDAHHGVSWASFKASAAECRDANTTQQLPYAWHFVAPAFSAAKNALPDITSVTAQFSGAGSVTNGAVAQKGKGWYIYTATGDTLLDAVGESTDNPETAYELVLSHTCGPTQSSSSSSSTTSSTTNSSSSSSTTTSSTTTSSSSSSSTTTTSSSGGSSSSSSTTTQSTPASSSSSSTTTSEASVSGSSLTQTTSTTPAVSGSSQTPQVSGVVIPRTLPRTGFDPGVLLMLGGMLVISGVLMLRYSDDTV